MGKRYKDKKLVKKFLRSLPDKFQSHKSAIDVSLDSDTLKFDQVVGMMQAYELQMKKKERSLGKSLALKAAEVPPSVSENQVGLIVKRFFRKMERGQRRGNPSDRRPDMSRDSKNSEKQCAECEGFGHYKSECPTLKKKGIRCYGCKGYGHTKAECVGNEEAKTKVIHHLE